MTEIPRLHDELVAAIEDRDPQRVAEIHLRIRQAEPPVEELLSEFGTAVRDDDIDKSKTVFGKLNSRYTTVLAERREETERATLARDTGALRADGRTTVREHLQAEQAVAMERAAFIAGATAFLGRPEEADREQVVEASDSLAAREQERSRTQQAAIEAIEGLTLPASVRVAGLDTDGPHDVGDRFTLTVTVANSGDEAATEVSVDVTGEDVTVVSTPDPIDRLPGGERRELSVELRTSSSGTPALTATVDSADAGSAQEVSSVTLVDPTGGDGGDGGGTDGGGGGSDGGGTESGGEDTATPTASPAPDEGGQAAVGSPEGGRSTDLPEWLLPAGGVAGVSLAGLGAYRYLFGGGNGGGDADG